VLVARLQEFLAALQGDDEGSEEFEGEGEGEGTPAAEELTADDNAAIARVGAA
jgi:hypothetical protein